MNQDSTSNNTPTRSRIKKQRANAHRTSAPPVLFNVHLNGNLSCTAVLLRRDQLQVILDVIEKKLGIVLDQSRYKLREKQNEEILEWDTVVRTVRTNELFLYPRYESSKTVYFFGTSLDKMPVHPTSKLPFVLHKCFQFLEREQSLRSVGLFRLTGNPQLIARYKNLFESAYNIEFTTSVDPNVVAGIVKDFFEKLKEPLLLASNYHELLRISDLSEYERLVKLQSLVHKLPACNFNVLKYLMEYFFRLVQYKSKNKVNIVNLAVIFGPMIITEGQLANRRATIRLPTTAKNVYLILFEAFIENYAFIFQKVNQTTPMSPVTETETSTSDNQKLEEEETEEFSIDKKLRTVELRLDSELQKNKILEKELERAKQRATERRIDMEAELNDWAEENAQLRSEISMLKKYIYQIEEKYGVYKSRSEKRKEKRERERREKLEKKEEIKKKTTTSNTASTPEHRDSIESYLDLEQTQGYTSQYEPSTDLNADCSHCGETIQTGSDCVEINGFHFHKACFLCNACNEPIADKLSQKWHGFYCETCVRENKFEKADTQPCTGCSILIPQADCIRALHKHYHAKCFRCYRCYSRFEENNFYSINSNATCVDCKRLLQ